MVRAINEFANKSVVFLLVLKSAKNRIISNVTIGDIFPIAPMIYIL